MTIKLLMLVIFFSIMIRVGFYSRRHATNVNDFVLGGRGVGPWLTAFAYGTSYFSAVVFIGYAAAYNTPCRMRCGQVRFAACPVVGCPIHGWRQW